MAITIRQPGAHDAEFLAWVMLSASRAQLRRGVWELLTGMDEAGCLDYLRRLTVTEPHSLCHYSAFLIAEVEGEPAAALSRFDCRTNGWAMVMQAMANVQRDLRWSERDVAAANERIAPMQDCFLLDVGADLGVENVATRPEYRRRGLVRMLLREVLREGRERGSQLAQIITYIGNTDAQFAYERAGFTCLDEKRCPGMAAALGPPGLMRFTRKVSPG